MNTQPNLFESYYNTAGERGAFLAIYADIAKKQDIAVLRFFQAHPDKVFSPCEVHEAVAKKGEPLTSVRRSITNLTDQGYLTQVKGTKKMGHMGRRTWTWKLKTKN